MVDPNMTETISPKCLRRFAEIAYSCLISVPKERPTMTQVVATLQAIEELQVKYVSSANLLGTMGFTWKIHKYIVSATKQNSDQHETSSLKSPENSMNQSSSSIQRDVKLFSYSELELATGSFRGGAFLGSGLYGKVYKGWVYKTTYSPCENSIGLPIVVKILHNDIFGVFQRYSYDLEMMKKYSHPNLVKVIGYCLEGNQHFLVYEFMPNETFKNLLISGKINKMSWDRKAKIAVGIARAIFFLLNLEGNVSSVNQDRLMPRMHRHKIFIEKDFTPKFLGYENRSSDKFEDSVSEGDDPDYYYPGCGPFLLQSNLSGFTVILAELLTGKLMSNKMTLNEIENRWTKLIGGSLKDFAKLCFNTCNMKDAESRMLKLFVKYENYIPKLTN